jgi:WhiB family transcriptional regulator, redox-sensing transcriptional regulator
MTVHMSWRGDAACRDADPDLFFPIAATGAASRQMEEAKQVCRVCPVQIQCRAWAVDNGVTDGIWGGTTPDERRIIRNLSRKTATTAK